jgi:hypothetical protein
MAMDCLEMRRIQLAGVGFVLKLADAPACGVCFKCG